MALIYAKKFQAGIMDALNKIIGVRYLVYLSAYHIQNAM